MTNTLVTCSIVAKEALAVLENLLSFAGNVNTNFQDEFTGNQARGYSPGQTINIKRPPRYTYRSGRVATPQATVETTVPLTLAQGGCDLNFTSIERTLSLQQLNQKITAAMATVTNEIDRQGLDLVRTSTYNAIGTVGTLPSTQAAALAALTGVNQRMDEMATPRDRQRTFISNPGMNAALIQGLAGLFNNQSTIGEQYKRGMMVDSLGLAYAMDQNVAVHTNGTQPTTGGTVNGASQTGSTINVNSGTITGTITAGSVITFAGVFAVNPQNRVSTGALAQFVITANVSAGASSITISPALTPSGAFQNVTASPANAAGITVLGAASASYACNVGYHRDAYTLAMPRLWGPPGGKGVIDVAYEEHNGMNLRVLQFFDGVNDNSVMRIDVLFGWAATYPELACKYVV